MRDILQRTKYFLHYFMFDKKKKKNAQKITENSILKQKAQLQMPAWNFELYEAWQNRVW